MYQINRSGLFKKQFLGFVADYKERANNDIASNFIDGVGKSTQFIAKNPKACTVYKNVGGYIFRKWKVKGFPHSIYFRVQDNTVILEAIYAHRMDTASRFETDF